MTLFAPQPAMATPAGEARMAAAVALVQNRIRHERVWRHADVLALLRQRRDLIAVNHPEVTYGEPLYYLVWQTNLVLAERGLTPVDVAELAD